MWKRTTIALAIAGTALVSFGCKDEAVEELQTLKDEMCACKDSKCIDEVLDKAEKWKEDHKGASTDTEKVKSLTNDMVNCALSVTEVEGGY